MVRTNSTPELASEPLLISIATEFDQSLLTGNGDFFRAAGEASDALEKGDFFEKLNIQTQALTIFEDLHQELGKRPTTQQVIERLKNLSILKKDDKRQEDRARKALAPLLKRA